MRKICDENLGSPKEVASVSYVINRNRKIKRHYHDVC